MGEESLVKGWTQTLVRRSRKELGRTQKRRVKPEVRNRTEDLKRNPTELFTAILELNRYFNGMAVAGAKRVKQNI